MYPELRRHRELSAGRFPRGPRAVTVPSAQPAQPCPLLTPAPCCRELSQPSVTLPGDCTGAVTACAAQTHPLYPSCSSEHPREGLCPPDSEPPLHGLQPRGGLWSLFVGTPRQRNSWKWCKPLLVWLLGLRAQTQTGPSRFPWGQQPSGRQQF